MILAATVTPGNRSDSEALGELVDAATQERQLVGLHIDRQYLHAPEIAQMLEDGGQVVCRAPAGSNRKGLFGKREFEIDVEEQVVRCPQGQEVAFQFGQTVEFPPEQCDVCPLRGQCTKRPKGRGRSLKIHENEAFHQELLQFEKTSEGRAQLRRRVGVEHGLSHVAQRQGNKARYIGTRKNTFELRIVCAIQNLERTQAFATQATASAQVTTMQKAA